MTTTTIPTADRLAEQFIETLRKWLTPGQLAEAVRLNATPGYAGCCATHDFCDANMAMAEAYEAVTGRAYDLDVEGEADGLWDAAWDMAKAAGFDAGKLKGGR